MPALRSPAEIVLLLDNVLIAAGALAALIFAIWLLRTGAWRRPLADAAPPMRYPSLLIVFALIAAYFGFAALLFAWDSGGRGDATSQPGTGAWNHGRLVEIAVNAFGAALAAIILARTRDPDAPRSRPLRSCIAALVMVWMLVPVLYPLERFSRLIWRLLRSGAPPVHPVLSGISDNEWGATGVVVLFISALVAAPLAEEFFFRGVLLRTMHGTFGLAWPAIITTGVLFGLMHHPQPSSVLPLMVMGIALGFLRLRTNSLGACVMVHMLFNARTMILATMAPENIAR